MQATMAGTAAALWLCILCSKRSGAAIVASGTFLQIGLLGAIILFAREPLYAAHLTTTEPWGLSALQDQQLAGLVIWLLGAVPYIAALMAQVIRLADDAVPLDATQ